MGMQCQIDRLPLKIRINTHIRRIVILSLGILLSAVSMSNQRALAQLDLADTPLMALVNSPPANIMVLVDDSGSMDYEILVKGQFEARYPSPIDPTKDGRKENGFSYVFDDMGDNSYPWDDKIPHNSKYNLLYMREEYRTFWRSQYSGENVLYYNPQVTYRPWTGYGTVTFPNADKNNPKPNPTEGNPLDLDATSFTVIQKVDQVTEIPLAVKHAHYFEQAADDTIYLAVIDGDDERINYYKVIETEGVDYAEKVIKVEAIDADDVPKAITGQREDNKACLTPTIDEQCLYDKERQNFANWFTYHRKGEYITKYAFARVIDRLEGVRVGLLSINGDLIVPLKPVHARIDGAIQDEKDEILEALYSYSAYGLTPLREGLNDVGKYYGANSKFLTHSGGGKVEGDRPPFFSEAEGGACQQCFTIVITDGYYNYKIKKGKDIKDHNGKAIGNADGPAHKTDFDRNALQDDLANTLADVAMHYYENDLSPDADDIPAGNGLPDKVPAYGFDKATHQHMVTFGVAFGLELNLNPKDYDKNSIYNNDNYSILWPEDIPEKQSQTLDDLWHATLNGRGLFYSADNPQELTDALLELTDSITAQLSGSAAAVTINGNQLYEKIGQETLMFQCSYSSENQEWSGDVQAFGFSTETGMLDTENYVWSAAEQLGAKLWSTRKIATYNPVAKTGIEFDYADLTDDQKIALGWDNVSGSEAETKATARIDFLKGKEIDGFRPRGLNSKDTNPDTPVLGDIVHSDPVYENDVVYAGGNDGMLHAFNTRKSTGTLGEELFAYVPNLVFENLIELTKPDYDHKFFIDLTPTVKKGAGLLEGNSPAAAEGVQTILVGGLGRGGKGYFALDITDPFGMNTAESVAQKVLWEFPSDSDPDMGFSFSKPAVVRSYDENHPWIVILGNGYNSTNGKAVLYILDPTGEPGVDLEVAKIDVGDGPQNGLSSPTAVDVNHDNVVDYVYAGDLKGNLWKFDLRAKKAADWKDAYNKHPLFTAKGPNNSNQPITTKPEVTRHPEFGYLVLFGTGKFLGESDFTDDSVQSVYGVWDFGDDTDDDEYLGTLDRQKNNALSNSNLDDHSSLLKQEITDFTASITTDMDIDVRVLTTEAVNWEVENDIHSGENPNPSKSVNNHVGWYFDLSNRERVDQDVLLREGKLIVLGWISDPYQCQPGGGTTMFMEIDALTGGNLSVVQFDLTGGGVLNQYDYVRADPNTADLLPPSGQKFIGKVHTPAVALIDKAFRRLDIDDDNEGLDKHGGTDTECGEEKYLSTSTGKIRIVCERSVNLGIGYWKEVGRDEQ
jgi:type IV pilus assembly protein PilY1